MAKKSKAITGTVAQPVAPVQSNVAVTPSATLIKTRHNMVWYDFRKGAANVVHPKKGIKVLTFMDKDTKKRKFLVVDLDTDKWIVYGGINTKGTDIWIQSELPELQESQAVQAVAV